VNNRAFHRRRAAAWKHAEMPAHGETRWIAAGGLPMFSRTFALMIARAFTEGPQTQKLIAARCSTASGRVPHWLHTLIREYRRFYTRPPRAREVVATLRAREPDIVHGLPRGALAPPISCRGPELAGATPAHSRRPRQLARPDTGRARIVRRPEGALRQVRRANPHRPLTGFDGLRWDWTRGLSTCSSSTHSSG
jgi:hypothetical protein